MEIQHTTRQGTADLLKGIAVLLMIQVHLTEVFGEPSFYASLLGRGSLFLGGPPVAPLFMMILGYFVGVSRKSFKGLILRGCILFVVALLLNAGLNFHLLLRIFNGSVALNPQPYLFGVDILFLAALSIIILALLRPVFQKMAVVSCAAILLVVILSPMMTELLTVSSPVRYVLAFVAGNYSWSYFPLFPWLAYPLLGFAFSLYRQKLVTLIGKMALKLVILLIAGLVTAITIKYAIGVSAELETYYHHNLIFFLWVVLFSGVWITAWSLMHEDFGETTIMRYVKWVGKNVTVVYAIQWLIIGNLGTSLYRTQNLQQLIVWYVLVVTAASMIAYFVLKSVDEWKRRGRKAQQTIN